MIGWSYTAARAVPYLAAAKIPWFTCCAVAAEESTYPNSFPMSGAVSLTLGLPLIVGRYCEKPAYVGLQLGAATFFSDLAKKTLRRYYGITDVKTVWVPVATSDVQSQVAQATSGTDCVEAGFDENTFASWMPAMKSLGQHQRMFGPSGNLDQKIVSRFPDQLEGAIAAGPYLDYNTPQWKPYREAVARYHRFDPRKWDYTGIGPQGTWVGMTIIANVLKKLQGPITGATLLDALNHTTNADSGGFGPPMNFARQFPAKGFERNFNYYTGYSIVKQGRLVPLDNKYHLVEPAWFGKPLSDPLFKK